MMSRGFLFRGERLSGVLRAIFEIISTIDGLKPVSNDGRSSIFEPAMMGRGQMKLMKIEGFKRDESKEDSKSTREMGEENGDVNELKILRQKLQFEILGIMVDKDGMTKEWELCFIRGKLELFIVVAFALCCFRMVLWMHSQ
jgi:hypothetical protein